MVRCFFSIFPLDDEALGNEEKNCFDANIENAVKREKHEKPN